MSRGRRVALALLAMSLAALGIGWLYLRLHPAAGNAALTLYGNVDIWEVQPAFNDTGPVTQMLVAEGDRLKKGQLLARIDDSRYAARLAQARKQAASLEATLSRLVHGSRPEEIAQAKATMEGLQAIYENSESVYARTLELLPQGLASTEDRDTAQAQVRSARASYQAAQQSYVLAVKGPRAEDIAAARTAYQSASAAADLAEREFADTNLYAPAEGIVEDRILEPGDMASPGTPVYTIALTEPLWVRAYLPETQLGKVAPGMAASITTDSFPGRSYRGWVGYIAPTAEFTPKTVETSELRTRLVYQVRIYACNARDELRLGMPATVTIDVAPASRAATGNAAAPACGPDDVGQR